MVATGYDPGPRACFGGACPHDHFADVLCDGCGAEFQVDVTWLGPFDEIDRVCDGCKEGL